MSQDDSVRDREPSDETLLLGAREGSMRDFETLVRRYEAPLFRFCRWMVQDASDAEDAFQEVFLRVYRHMERFHAGSRFRPWLYHIATNICRDTLRKRKRVRAREVLTDGDAPSDPVPPTPDGGAYSPRAAAIASETARRIDAAIEQLRPRHRAVFLMARYQGLSYEEIAHVLRIPVGTVRSRMNKAVKVVLNALEDDER